MISSMCTNTKCTNVHKFNVGKDLKLKCKLEWPNINEELVHELYRSPFSTPPPHQGLIQDFWLGGGGQ